MKNLDSDHFKKILEGLNVKDIYINFLNEESHPLASFVVLSSGVCGLKTFATMRKAINGSRCYMPFWDVSRHMEAVKLPIQNNRFKSIWFKWCDGELEGYPPKPDSIPKYPELMYRKEYEEMNGK